MIRKKRMPEENIFLFVPNLIGYGRIILVLVSFYYMPFNPWMAGITYLLSGFLDAFDGWSARKLKQGTSFGAALDMITDRCSTTCLIMVLCVFYPSYAFLFQCVVALDISSHWLQMYSSLVQGDNSHKVTDLGANPILRLYYKRVSLFIFCACNELFFAALYFRHFSYGPIIPLFGSSIGLWTLLAFVTFPVSLTKNLISVLQMVLAARNVGALDVAQRVRDGLSGST